MKSHSDEAIQDLLVLDSEMEDLKNEDIDKYQV